ncbi:MAG: hypothetical protein Q7S87_01265 [Agitococcus sp.]|nr:hypothetical protein [Agitococcus sp.]MDO9179155.1 hypothetical protein [Agitococcus sp.]
MKTINAVVVPKAGLHEQLSSRRAFPTLATGAIKREYRRHERHSLKAELKKDMYQQVQQDFGMIFMSAPVINSNFVPEPSHSAQYAVKVTRKAKFQRLLVEKIVVTVSTYQAPRSYY